MSKFSDTMSELATEIVAFVIGWVLCLSAIAGFYVLGYWAWPYLVYYDAARAVVDRHTLGLLSSITFIWLCERQQADSRIERIEKIASER